MKNLDKRALELIARNEIENSICPDCKDKSIISQKFGDVIMYHCVICGLTIRLEDRN